MEDSDKGLGGGGTREGVQKPWEEIREPRKEVRTPKK